MLDMNQGQTPSTSPLTTAPSCGDKFKQIFGENDLDNLLKLLFKN